MCAHSACVRALMRASVHVRACSSVCGRARMCVCVCSPVSVCVCVCVCVCVRARARSRAPVALRIRFLLRPGFVAFYF